MLACNLKMKPAKGASGSRSPWLVRAAPGEGASSTKLLRKCSTPKLFMAEPKNTGVSSPARKAEASNSGMAPWMSSTSSRSLAARSLPTRSSRRGSSRPAVCIGARCLPPEVRSKASTCPVWRSYTPLKSGPSPMGQVSGTTVIFRVSSTWAMSSKGSRAGRSILFTKVRMGISRLRHTAKSFSVWVCTPRAASSTISAESAAVRVR